MRLKISFEGAWWLGVLALTSRIFTGIVLDQTELYIAGWIGIFVGLVLWLPVIWACRIVSHSCKAYEPARMLQKTTGAVPSAVLKVVLLTILLTILLWDAAGVSIVAIETMGYATMLDIRGIYFLLPLCMVMFGVLLTNGRGIGCMAGLWARILPFLFLLLLIQRFPNYVFRWLGPFWGSGGSAIINGGIASAGLLSPLVALWLIAEPEKENKKSDWKTPLTMLLLAASLAAVLSLLHSAMLPAQTSGMDTRIFRLDSILTNGRAVLGSQMPVLIIWYASQLITLAFELFLAAALLQRLIPRLNGAVCAFLVCVVACVVAWNGFAGQAAMILLAKWEYLLVAIPLLLVLFIEYIKGGKEEFTCEESE